jgi:hypothetical protein
MVRRSLRQSVVRGRWLVASCGSPSYVGDGSSQVAAACRTWTMARRSLRQPVVRGRWPVASCGSPSSVDDGSSQVAAARRTWTMVRRSCGSPSSVDDGPSQVAAARRTWTTARRSLRNWRFSARLNFPHSPKVPKGRRQLARKPCLRPSSPVEAETPTTQPDDFPGPLSRVGPKSAPGPASSSPWRSHAVDLV